MKKLCILLPVIMVAASVRGAESADTIGVQNLEEIVVQAPKVIHKADMDVYHPSQSAVENSKNGVQLLSNLMIPTLSVSDALGTIQGNRIKIWP